MIAFSWAPEASQQSSCPKQNSIFGVHSQFPKIWQWTLPIYNSSPSIQALKLSPKEQQKDLPQKYKGWSTSRIAEADEHIAETYIDRLISIAPQTLIVPHISNMLTSPGKWMSLVHMNRPKVIHIARERS